ncbi:MAG: hypothetical protein LBI06_08245 [Treponema sp.]|jgi:hypothetical protein|nr:hypothetical protein [Treponema sp.]
MKIKIKYPRSQVCWAVCALFFVAACNLKKEEIPAMPPLTSPLSQSFIGFGVVNVSYTRVSIQPAEANPDENISPGYLRRGSVVSILQRRTIRNQGSSESWVLVEGDTSGWLKENLVDIYDSELQARTASEAMGG